MPDPQTTPRTLGGVLRAAAHQAAEQARADAQRAAAEARRTLAEQAAEARRTLADLRAAERQARARRAEARRRRGLSRHGPIARRMRGACNRQARPRSRRTAASSSTSSADPGEPPGDATPALLRTAQLAEVGS